MIVLNPQHNLGMGKIIFFTLIVNNTTTTTKIELYMFTFQKMHEQKFLHLIYNNQMFELSLKKNKK